MSLSRSDARLLSSFILSFFTYLALYHNQMVCCCCTYPWRRPSSHIAKSHFCDKAIQRRKDLKHDLRLTIQLRLFQFSIIASKWYVLFGKHIRRSFVIRHHRKEIPLYRWIFPVVSAPIESIHPWSFLGSGANQAEINDLAFAFRRRSRHRYHHFSLFLCFHRGSFGAENFSFFLSFALSDVDRTRERMER